MYAIKIKFSAYKDEYEMAPLKGFEYKWAGESDDPAEFLTNLREFIEAEANPHKGIDDEDWTAFLATLEDEDAVAVVE